jgi:hypothetical protein
MKANKWAEVKRSLMKAELKKLTKEYMSKLDTPKGAYDKMIATKAMMRARKKLKQKLVAMKGIFTSKLKSALTETKEQTERTISERLQENKYVRGTPKATELAKKFHLIRTDEAMTAGVAHSGMLELQRKLEKVWLPTEAKAQKTTVKAEEKAKMETKVKSKASKRVDEKLAAMKKADSKGAERKIKAAKAKVSMLRKAAAGGNAEAKSALKVAKKKLEAARTTGGGKKSTVKFDAVTQAKTGKLPLSMSLRILNPKGNTLLKIAEKKNPGAAKPSKNPITAAVNSAFAKLPLEFKLIANEAAKTFIKQQKTASPAAQKRSMKQAEIYAYVTSHAKGAAKTKLDQRVGSVVAAKKALNNAEPGAAAKASKAQVALDAAVAEALPKLPKKVQEKVKFMQQNLATLASSTKPGSTRERVKALANDSANASVDAHIHKTSGTSKKDRKARAKATPKSEVFLEEEEEPEEGDIYLGEEEGSEVMPLFDEEFEHMRS